MESIKTMVLNRVSKWNWLYVPYREIKLKRRKNRNLLNDAVEKFKEESPEHGDIQDYKNALRLYRVSYREYCAWEFWKLDTSKRREYLAEAEMTTIYRKTAQASAIICIANKVLSLKTLNKFVHRKWVYPRNDTFDEFVELVTSFDCIVKPVSGSLGHGIFKIMKNEKKDLLELYNYCSEENLVVEEYVRACEELESFHPQSLNTLRVMTIANVGRCEVVAAELRIGIGDSFVDNAAAGGIVAPIDLSSGIILMDGMDKSGNRYVIHPDSGKVIKGVAIPHWDQVVRVCKEMTALFTGISFVGWDISVLKSGEIELIEVNSTPNVMGLQIAYRKGLKPRFQKLGKEVLGYDPLKLVSIWSKSYVNYAERKRQLKETGTRWLS